MGIFGQFSQRRYFFNKHEQYHTAETDASDIRPNLDIPFPWVNDTIEFWKAHEELGLYFQRFYIQSGRCSGRPGDVAQRSRF